MLLKITPQQLPLVINAWKQISKLLAHLLSETFFFFQKAQQQLAATVIHELHLISQSTFFFDTFVRKLLTFDTQALKQVIKMQRDI